ncbi:hypothetical protein BDZ45DRAFT_251790 [Acephala macrosclerotiorum]|nr:hypothetical protein BDZ45DRAFT_251790 [Acephala macrosclerotiorum]
MVNLLFNVLFLSCFVTATDAIRLDRRNAGVCESIWVTIWAGDEPPPETHLESSNTYTLATPYQTLGTTTTQVPPIASSHPQGPDPPGLNQTCNSQSPCQASTGLCCGQSGICGYGPDSCGAGCQRDAGYCPLAPSTKDGRCGVFYDTSCFDWPAGECCSQSNECGSGAGSCGIGCQGGGTWGICGLDSSSSAVSGPPSSLPSLRSSTLAKSAEKFLPTPSLPVSIPLYPPSSTLAEPAATSTPSSCPSPIVTFYSQPEFQGDAYPACRPLNTCTNMPLEYEN